MSLALNHLAGFGVPKGPNFISNGNITIDGSNAFSSQQIDFGPPGRKQIIAAVAVWDGGVDDSFTLAMDLDGTALTQVEKREYIATAGVTIGGGIFVIETFKSGKGFITGQISGFTGGGAFGMDQAALGVLVTKGYDLTPVASGFSRLGDGGDEGNSISIDTTGASLVIVAGSDRGALPDAITGPGAVSLIAGAYRVSVGYGVPVSSPSVYDFTNDTDLIVAASFRKM